MKKKQHILLVDDRPENLAALDTILEKPNLEIKKASSGHEALRLLLKYNFAVVLLDVQMPGMDGFEVAELMQRNQKTKNTPIIFVTAISKEKQFIFKGYKSGAVDYLFKPLNPEILKGKVEVFLGLDKQKQKLEESIAEVKQLTKKNDLILKSVAEGIIGISKYGDITFANPAAAKILKADVTLLDHYQLKNIFFPQSEGKRSQDKELTWQDTTVYQRCILGEECHVENATFWREDDTCFSVEYSATPIYQEDNEFSGVVLVFRDITERKLAEEKLVQLARYDVLTGLGNRALFLDMLVKAISRAERSGNTVALLFLDLDRFKQINDSLGHDVGDQLLKEVAKRIKVCTREGDLVSRLGGDEFTVLLESTTAREAAIVSQKVIDAIATPFAIDGQEIFMGISIGIATFPNFAADADALLKSADMAMYHAKSQGRNNYQFFTPTMQHQVVERLNLENKLRHAIEKNQLQLYYQPQIDIQTGKIVGLEALLRWQMGEVMISPSQFIPIAEETGLIIPIGEWVLATACEQIATWHQTKLVKSPVTVAVNLSIRQLNNDLLTALKTILLDTKIDPACLELELTESIVVEDLEYTSQLLQKMHNLGVNICIDDFGTGYSSLNCLKHLPIDVLKIDRSFVHDIGMSTHGEAIVKAVAAMAQGLNLRTVAEGIETKEQLAFLEQHRCYCIQGNYFFEPMSVMDVTKLLRVSEPVKSKLSMLPKPKLKKIG